MTQELVSRGWRNNPMVRLFPRFEKTSESDADGRL